MVITRCLTASRFLLCSECEEGGFEVFIFEECQHFSISVVAVQLPCSEWLAGCCRSFEPPSGLRILWIGAFTPPVGTVVGLVVVGLVNDFLLWSFSLFFSDSVLHR